MYSFTNIVILLHFKLLFITNMTFCTVLIMMSYDVTCFLNKYDLKYKKAFL